MRYIIMKNNNNVNEIIDMQKSEYQLQQRYVMDNEGIIKGTLNKIYSDPIEALNDFITIQVKDMQEKILKEVKRYERY